MYQCIWWRGGRIISVGTARPHRTLQPVLTVLTVLCLLTGLLQRSSLSPGEQAAAAIRDRAVTRPGSPEAKKLKRDPEPVSDGEKSDADLVVDDANEVGNKFIRHPID